MKDGIYSFRYEAFGRLSRGTLTLKDGRAHGGDTRVLLEGEVGNVAHNVTATLEVRSVGRVMPSHAHYGMLDFAVRLTGPGSDSHFDVIGVGPRGLIVCLAGEWTAPLVEHSA